MKLLQTYLAREKEYMISVAQAKQGDLADQRRVWIIFSGLMLGMLIASLDHTVVALDLAEHLQVSMERLTPSVEQLKKSGPVSLTSQADEQVAGQLVLDKLSTAYHDSLVELLDDWSPEQEEELDKLLRQMVTKLLSEDTSKELVEAPV